MKKLIAPILLLILMGCATQPKEPRLISPITTRDKTMDSTNDNTNDNAASRIFFRVDSVYVNENAQWFFSALVPNISFSSSKTLSSDFGNQIEIEWAARRETLQLENDGLHYVLPPTPINASEAGSLFNSGVRLLTTSGSALSNQIAVTSRPFANPLTPTNPEDYDLSNCFGGSPAPNVVWLPGPSGTNLNITFSRNDTTLIKTYTGLRDEQGRWNDGIANRDLFNQVISSSERAQSQEEEFVADVDRMLSRQQALGQITLNSVPRKTLNAVLEVVERRAIFIYYLGSCE